VEQPAIFKGTLEGITVLLNPSFSNEEIISYLEKTLNERKVFFSGANLTIEPNGINMDNDTIQRMESIFKRFGITFTIKGVGTFANKEKIEQNAIEDKETIVITHTIRSGQVVSHDGNIVILGDINEGGEVNAKGNIYVFGVIRGIVSAGESIVSLGFMPLRMTIGKTVFGIQGSTKTYRKPRVAKVENGKIVIKVLGEKKSLRR
jgi:septum site-determining protein MinC